MELPMNYRYNTVVAGAMDWLKKDESVELYRLASNLDMCLDCIENPETRADAVAFAVSIAKLVQLSELHKNQKSKKKV